MNCKPNPESTCGSLMNDSCIVITGTWPSCFPNQEDTCHRQSEFNEATAELLCPLIESVATIESSIDLSGLTGCTGILPIKTTVKAEFQNLYNIVCGIKVDLNLPVNGLTIPDCIKDPCDNTPTTLGILLQAILDKIEECCCASGQ